MAATPVVINLCRSRGDTFADQFTVKDAAGAVININGATFLLTVDPEPDPTTSANNLFQLTGVIVNGPLGIVSFTPNATQLDQTPNVYFYDIQMTDINAAIRTIAKGKYEISPDITKN